VRVRRGYSRGQEKPPTLRRHLPHAREHWPLTLSALGAAVRRGIEVDAACVAPEPDDPAAAHEQREAFESGVPSVEPEDRSENRFHHAPLLQGSSVYDARPPVTVDRTGGGEEPAEPPEMGRPGRRGNRGSDGARGHQPGGARRRPSPPGWFGISPPPPAHADPLSVPLLPPVRGEVERAVLVSRCSGVYVDEPQVVQEDVQGPSGQHAHVLPRTEPIGSLRDVQPSVLAPLIDAQAVTLRGFQGAPRRRACTPRLRASSCRPRTRSRCTMSRPQTVQGHWPR
jgi:hypothetical protein